MGSFRKCVDSRGRIVALKLAAALWLFVAMGVPSGYAQDMDLTVPFALSTAAAGLVPADSNEINIAIARLDLTPQQPATEILEHPGFVVVLSGSVSIFNTAGEPTAALDANDAHWVSNGDQVFTSAETGEATVWLVAIGLDANGRTLGGTDPYTFTLRAPEITGTNPYSPFVVRIGLAPANSSLSLGSEGDQVAYAFSLSGDISIDGVELTSGTFTSPFFDQPGVQIGDEAALIGYIARSRTVDPVLLNAG